MRERVAAVGRWMRERKLRLFKGLLGVLVVGAVLGGGYLVLWELPKHEAGQVTADAEERAEIENDFRATLAQIVLGVGIFVGLYLTWRRIRATELQAESAQRQAASAESGQLTERFTRAIEQLGKQGEEHTAIRLGGIYALERILRDSDDDAPTVREVLAAFVRDESVVRWRRHEKLVEASEDGGKGEGGEGEEPSGFKVSEHTDLQAALTVLGRNPMEEPRMDLRGAHLEGAYLFEAHLEGAALAGAHFEDADLSGAHLEGAYLFKAHLEGAVLFGAHFEDADLSGAHLEGAFLVGAHLKDAVLKDADLTDADVRGTILESTEEDEEDEEDEEETD